MLEQVVKGYKAIDDGLTEALTGADIVLVTAGPAGSHPQQTFLIRE